MTSPPDFSALPEADKTALLVLLWTQVEALTAEVAALKAKLSEPVKTSETSSLPPSQDRKANRPDKAKRPGPRRGSLGRKGGGRALAQDPDQVVSAKATACVHCRGRLADDDQRLQARYGPLGNAAGGTRSIGRRCVRWSRG